MVKDMGERIRRARVKAKISQKDLGKMAGLTLSYVNMLERCQRIASIDTLLRLSDALGVKPANLINLQKGAQP